jgi:hypothetical protein
LRDQLRHLPVEKVSSDFTAEVLAQLDRPARPGKPRLLIPAAAVLLAGAIVFTLSLQMFQPQESNTTAASPQSSIAAPALSSSHQAVATARARADLAALQEEQRQLQNQWREYRRLARAADPVLYLGGNDKVDLVIDLRRVSAEDLRVNAIPAAMTNRRVP